MEWVNDWSAVADWLDWYYYPEKIKFKIYTDPKVDPNNPKSHLMGYKGTSSISNEGWIIQPDGSWVHYGASKNCKCPHRNIDQVEGKND